MYFPPVIPILRGAHGDSNKTFRTETSQNLLIFCVRITFSGTLIHLLPVILVVFGNVQYLHIKGPWKLYCVAKRYKTKISGKKWNQSTWNVVVTNLVLVVDEDWPLACVIRILRGKNDTVRAYEVRTKTGIKKKPVSKLAFAEVFYLRRTLSGECEDWT